MEKGLLQHDVLIRLIGVSQGFFVGSVLHPTTHGNISEYLLAEGYAKISGLILDDAYVSKFHAAQS